MSPTFPPQLEPEPVAGGETSSVPSLESATLRTASMPSLSEAYRTIPVSHTASWIRKVLAFAGPGYLVAVGYMDPGNWATDIGGG
jgi:manganese transport protein